MKEIEGYNGRYSITKTGEVFSHRRKAFVKTHIDLRGYVALQLFIDGVKKNERIHRLLAETFIPNENNYKIVDHINRNKLDNRIENLRWVTETISCVNQSKMQRKGGCTSKHRGVSYDRYKWVAYIRAGKNRIYLGRFDKEEDAALAYNTCAKLLWGDYSVLNSI